MFVGIVIICKDAVFILVDLLYVCDKSVGKTNSYIFSYLNMFKRKINSISI